MTPHLLPQVGASSKVVAFAANTKITEGRLEGHGRRAKALIADYVLVYRNTKLAVVEAKAWDEQLTQGLAQAKDYAGKLAIRFSYA